MPGVHSIINAESQMIFQPSKRDEAHKSLDVIFDAGRRAKVERVPERRSNNQNRYMHGVVFTLFAYELGWTLDEAKQYFKGQFLTYEKDGHTFVKETKSLDTKQTEHFLDKCRTEASKHGIYIPVPNELTEEDWLRLEEYDRRLH